MKSRQFTKNEQNNNLHRQANGMLYWLQVQLNVVTIAELKPVMSVVLDACRSKLDVGSLSYFWWSWCSIYQIELGFNWYEGSRINTSSLDVASSKPPVVNRMAAAVDERLSLRPNIPKARPRVFIIVFALRQGISNLPSVFLTINK